MQLNSIINVVDDMTASNWMCGLKKEEIQKMENMSVIGIGNLSKVEQEGYGIPAYVGAGDTLVMNPYGGAYYELIQDAKINFAHDKFNKICDIAQWLGAESYKIRNLTIEDVKDKKDISGEANVKKVSIEGKATIEDTSSTFNGFLIEDRLEGVKVLDENSYKYVQDLARQYKLDRDPNIASLIRSRNPKIPSPIISRHLRVEMNQEIHHILDITGSLESLECFKLSAAVKISKDERKREVLDIEFFFPTCGKTV